MNKEYFGLDLIEWFFCLCAGLFSYIIGTTFSLNKISSILVMFSSILIFSSIIQLRNNHIKRLKQRENTKED